MNMGVELPMTYVRVYMTSKVSTVRRFSVASVGPTVART